MHQLLLYSLCLWAVVVFCAPAPVEARRVIFLKPNGIHRGQILATHGMEKPCPQCHMHDHRGNCRRIIAYNAGGSGPMPQITYAHYVCAQCVTVIARLHTVRSSPL